MPLAVFLPEQYQSRYNLLGAMSREIGEAFASAGAEINPARSIPIGFPTIHLFCNFPQRYDEFLRWVQPDRPQSAIIQFFVDHPLAVSSSFLDMASSLPNFRLLLPCHDELSLLRMRFPRLRAIPCLHGVAPSALCPIESITAARQSHITVAGTILTDEEIAALRSSVPGELHTTCDQIVEVMQQGHVRSFVGAFDAIAPAILWSNNLWGVVQQVARYCTAKVNAITRVAMVQSLQGLPVRVYGPAAWQSHVSGTLRYAGQADYESLPGVWRESVAALAWNPSQFVESISERLLMTLAGGCATVTDDRLLARKHFAGAATLVDPFSQGSVHAAFDRILTHPAQAREMAVEGRRRIEAAHLWQHRVEAMIQIVGQMFASQAPQR